MSSQPSSLDKDAIEAKIVDGLKSIYDPEIPVSIYELGLIYEVNVDDEGQVEIIMTLTTPNCPEAQSLPAKVESETAVVEGVSGVKVDIVWDPPWGPDRMSEAAKLALGF